MRTFQRMQMLALAVVTSLVYVAVSTNSGAGVAEDPTFQNGKYLVAHILHRYGPDQTGLLTDGFKSLVMPYGLLSWLIDFMIQSSLTHFRAQLFFHIFVTYIALYLSYRIFVRRSLAFILILLTLSTQAFYEQFLYSIGSSQIVLLSLFILTFGGYTYPKLQKTLLSSLVALTLSVSLWSNLPQLVATWLVCIVLVFLRLLDGPKSVKGAGQHFAIIVVCALVLYSPFLYELTIQKTAIWDASKSIALSEFRNSGLLKVIQGFGKWSILDTNWIVPRYDSDMNPARQAIRLLIPCVVFVASAMTIIKSQLKSLLAQFYCLTLLSPFFIWITSMSNLAPGQLLMTGFTIFLLTTLKIRNEGFDEFQCNQNGEILLRFACATQIVLLLNMLGSWDWYWSFRRISPVLFAFREPWAKFSQPYVVILLCCLGIILERLVARLQLLRRGTVRRFSWIVLFMLALYLLLPVHLSGSVRRASDNQPFVAPAVSEWARADSLILHTRRFMNNSAICIVNFDPRGLIAGLLRTTYPITSSFDSSCHKRLKYVKVVTRNYMKSLNVQTSLRLYDRECLLFSSDEILVVSGGCALRIDRSIQTVFIYQIDPKLVIE